jgi:SAM-dependent methyltransferase
MMAKISDQAYLVSQQYSDASHLAARGTLYERFSVNPYGWFAWLFDHFRFPIESRILEVGCGTSLLWLKNLERIPASWEVTLSDLSDGMLREARRMLEGTSHPFSFAVVDAQAIPYHDGSFDAVVANFMLFHVPDRSKAIREIRRVLRPGGHLYAATGGVANLRELTAFKPDRDDDFGRELRFSLENGGDQLAAWFAHVECHRYDDALVVTEAEPLIAHIASKYISSPLDDEARAGLVQRVHEALAANGAIRLTKDHGLFDAW